MSCYFQWIAALALGLGLVSGCGDDASAMGGDGGSGGMGGEGGGAGTNGELVSLRVSINSFEPPLPSEAVEGRSICELETNNCVVTDAEGLATLEGSAGEIALSMDGAGMAPYIYTYILRAGGPSLVLFSATESRLEEMFGLVMSPYPMGGTGAIWVSALPEGAMLTLLGATGKPFYAEDDAKWSWSPDLSAVTARGGGGFVEVPPGDYQVEVSGTSKNCLPARGWPGDSENTIRVLVREGYLSATQMQCD